MKCDFKAAKAMAQSMASRFSVAYINFNRQCGYYVTSCQTSNTIGHMTKAGKFVVWDMQKNSLSVWKR